MKHKVGPEYPGEGAAKTSAAGSTSIHPDDFIRKEEPDLGGRASSSKLL